MKKSNPFFDLDSLHSLIYKNKNFVFVRFSDGELEVLKNRCLIIENGVTKFRGETFTNNFEHYDSKKYIPNSMDSIRADLLASLMFKDKCYIKGIPSKHTLQDSDQNYCLRMNGGMDSCITYADLLVNWNHQRFIKETIPLLQSLGRDIVVIANKNAKIEKDLKVKSHIAIESNFFNTYEIHKNNLISSIEMLAPKTIILSSASSLSNIIGHYIAKNKLDLIFLDVGTAINNFLNFKSNAREYLKKNNSKYKSHFGFRNYEW